MFLLFQIGDLFRGNMNWRGVLHLTLFIIMGLIVIAISGLFISLVVKERRKRNGD